MQTLQHGAALFRHNIVCSILSNRPLQLTGIHPNDSPRGIKDYEANFLKLVDRVTNGTKIAVSDSNTTLTLQPGLIMGGTFSHDVPPSRSVAYAIEAIILLLPFAKYPTEITFTGLTQHDDDLAVDTLRDCTLRWVRSFGVECQLRIVRRSAAASDHGTGCVILSVSNVRKLRGVDFTQRGKIRRIRGVAFACRAASDLPNRCAVAAKGLLLKFLPDVYVVTDVGADEGRKKNVGGSGHGISLIAESTSSCCFLSQEATASLHEPPEDVGLRAARLLLDQVVQGGCVDSHHQQLVMSFMALTPDQVSTVRFGELTDVAVSTLAAMELFFGVTCAIKQEPSPYGDEFAPSNVISCIGSNIVNLTKRSG